MSISRLTFFTTFGELTSFFGVKKERSSGELGHTHTRLFALQHYRKEGRYGGTGRPSPADDTVTTVEGAVEDSRTAYRWELNNCKATS